MQSHKQAQFPTIPPPEYQYDPSAPQNQTVAHKIASQFPKVAADVPAQYDPNEIRTIPLRPGPLPPEIAKFPKFLWHAVEEAKIVNDEQELSDALLNGYLTEKPTADSAGADQIKEAIKRAEANLKRLKANLAALNGKK